MEIETPIPRAGVASDPPLLVSVAPPETIAAARPEVELRRLTRVEDFAAAERLQIAVWGRDGFVVVPTVMLIIGHNAGGGTLGAFDEGGEMVGVVSWIAGTDARGRRMCYSVMNAVHGAWRGRGLGLRLKLAQRLEALRQGVSLIRWTFDPLLDVNAGLNVGRLGARCATYLVDYYGQSPDDPLRSLPTDRLFVEWWLEEEIVLRRLAGERCEPPDGAVVNRVEPAGEHGLPVNVAIDLELAAPRLRVEIPDQFGALRRRSPALAERWRAQTREVFLSYFGRGYRVCGFAPQQGCGGHYLLAAGAEGAP